MYVRFRTGENLEIISKNYLLLFIVTKVVMNAQAFADIRGWDNRDFDPVSNIAG